MKTNRYLRIILFVLAALLLVSCGTLEVGIEETPVPPNLEAVTDTPQAPTPRTPTPDPTDVAAANYQATLNMNKTQNAAHYATSAAMMTATRQARPPTATPTSPPPATPTEEGGIVVHGVLVHDADTRTGLDDVDPIIDVVLTGDMNEFRRKINFTTLGCTHVMALGGPPKCREGEPEGTLVEVLPFLGPEGHHMRRDDLNNWQGIDVAGLYAVYRVSDGAYSSQDYPAGEYGIVFRTKDPHDIVTLQVENGSILRYDSTFILQIDPGFSIPPEINEEFAREAQEIILPPPNIKECPGAPPQRVMIGEQASVCTQSDDLIVREEPGRDGKALTGIEPGTNFMIIAGPSCADNWSWWKVELDSGLEGWIAEGGDDIDPYFICPVN